MVIRRYLYKELYFNLIAIIWVLLLLLITNQLVHYLKNAAMGEIPMRTVLQIMALQIPILLGYFLPLACYLSVLLTLGRWSMDRETVVLAACGVSRHQLLRMVMVFASVVALVVAWLMLFVEPRVQEVRTLVLEQAMTQASIDKIIPNRFETLYPNTVFYAQKVDRTTARMQNVFFAIKTWPKPLPKGSPSWEAGGAGPHWDVTVAQSAQLLSIPGRGQVAVFHQGHRYLGQAGQHQLREIAFKTYSLTILPPSIHLHDWPLTASTASLWGVRHQHPKAQATLQWRLAMPLSVLLFALLAFPLSEVRPRQGKFARFIPAIILYGVYANLLILGRAWISKGVLSGALGLWPIHGLFFVLGLSLYLYRYRFEYRFWRWRRRSHATA